jgi:hypothetical protein
VSLHKFLQISQFAAVALGTSNIEDALEQALVLLIELLVLK